MEPSSSEQQFCLRWNNHSSNLLSAFRELLHNEAFTDVTLVVDGGPSFLKCHKMILAACSDYFWSLFKHISTVDNHALVVLRDVEYNLMKLILEYMYHGEVKIAEDQLQRFFEIAEQLEVKGLVKESQPAISSTGQARPVHRNENISNGHAPQPHSTSLPYYSEHNRSNGQNPWPTSSCSLTNLALAAQSVMNSTLAPTSASGLFPGLYNVENTKIKRKRKSTIKRRAPPVLRPVFDQGQADSSQEMMNHHEPRDNESESEMQQDMSYEHHCDSPYSGEMSMEGEEGTYSPRTKQKSKDKDSKSYKNYSQEGMEKAIEEVRLGKMSALKAADKYGIPSRTLYDKVKKLGIRTQRSVRRSLSADGGQFRRKIGGKRSDSMSDHENESLMEGSSALLDMANGHARK